MTCYRVLAAAFAASLLAAAPAGAARLRSFPNCAALVQYGQAHAPETTTSPGRPGVASPQTTAAEGDGAKTAAPAVPDDASTTNVQEAGVDEPDVVKSDGHTIFAVHGNRLYAADARAKSPSMVGSIDLPAGSGHELLISGDTLLVTASVGSDIRPFPIEGPVARPAIAIRPYFNPQTVLAQIDVSDPSAMRIKRTLTVDGSVVSSRLADGTVHVVLSSFARAVAQPDERAKSTSWRPAATLRLGRSKNGATRPLLPCDAIRYPGEPSGVSMLSVLTIDLSQGLDPVDVDGLVTDAHTVYASADELDVATNAYGDAQTSTEIHSFGTSEPDRTTYRGSGAVPGTLLNQFSMSEYKGALRVATTTDPSFDPQTGEPTGDSESAVTTLGLRDGSLQRLGRVEGLGKGERIYAVRFLGDTGYVVTFRQIDPLYVLDLSDASKPRVAGELKIEGYSSYLHPIGGDLLLGVGQDATAEGRRAGTQVSLFDVADPAHPTRLSRAKLGADTSSEVEYDHHAFLWWPATHLAVVPVQGGSFSGAVGFSATRAEGVDEVGRVTHPDGNGVRRSLVVGDRLVTLGEDGLQFERLSTLAGEKLVPFGAPERRR